MGQYLVVNMKLNQQDRFLYDPERQGSLLKKGKRKFQNKYILNV